MGNYQKVISPLLKKGVRVIPVICYRPAARWPYHNYVAFDELVTAISKLMLPVFRKHKLPVIDLSRTFNPEDETHYSRMSSIEPSNDSGMFIAKLVKHITETHDWTGPSMLYYGAGEIQSEAYPKGHAITFPER